MTNTKATKRALGSSVLALFLCFAMLLGTTYAWFTDNVTSANNIITAGNLDVELYYQAEGQSDWTQVTTGTNVFKGTLWEPGHTEVVRLKVVNEGSLALKYQLGVNIVDETGSTTKDGDPLMLSDYIKYGIVDGAKSYTRDTAIAAVEGNATPLKNAYSSDSIKLNSKEEKIVTMVVYMPETVGNEANYMTGAAKPEIQLGINVFATQASVENDSYGKDYDKDAVYYDVLVSTVDELYAAVEAASGDIVIAIDGAITLTKTLSKSGLKSIKFVPWNGSATIDQATYNMHFDGARVTFEGLTLTHGEKAYGNGGQTSTAFAVWNAKEVNYVDCTFNRSVGTIHAGIHNFIGCVFNGVENPGNTKSEYPLYICDGEEYNVIDCTFNCTNRGAILFYNDGGDGTDTLNISNTRFFGDIISDKTAVEIHNNSQTQVYNVNIKDVMVGDGVINGLYRIKPANVGEVNVIAEGVKEVYNASNKNELNSKIENARPGETICFENDIDLSNGTFEIRNDVIVDLCGQTITGKHGWAIISLYNGASVRNGHIKVESNVAAIKAYNAGSIENITIHIDPIEYNKIATAIAVQEHGGNGHVELIKDVTITGATQGIEIIGSGAKIDKIENVHIETVYNGKKTDGTVCNGVALQVVNGSVGEIINSTFKGENYGVQMIVKGGYDVSVTMTNCTVEGGDAAVYVHNNGISNTSPITFIYDADTIIKGEIKDGLSANYSGTSTVTKKEN